MSGEPVGVGDGGTWGGQSRGRLRWEELSRDAELVGALVSLVARDPEASVVVWSDGVATWCSPGAEQLTGVSVGQQLAELGVGAEALCGDSCTRRVLVHARWLDVRSARVGGRVVSLWRDAGDEVGALEALESSFAALARSEARYRRVVESAGDGLTLTRRGVLEWCSPAFSRLCGPVLEGTGRIVLVELVHDEDGGLLDEALDAARNGAGSRPRLRVVGADGGWHWADVDLCGVRGEDGTHEGELGSWRVVDAEVSYLRALADSEARNRELAAQLQVALDSRVVLEQAKGMVAAMRGIGVEESYSLLRDHARRTDRKLKDVARDVVELGLRP